MTREQATSRARALFWNYTDQPGPRNETEEKAKRLTHAADWDGAETLLRTLPPITN